MQNNQGILGFRCSSCAHVQVESFVVCPICLGRDQSSEALDPRATLYSFTVLRTGSESEGLGYADLASGARTLVTLEAPFDRYACDAPVILEQWAKLTLAKPGNGYA